MTPQDKKKLQDAWRKAAEKNPDVDKPIEGLVFGDGTPVTPRKLMEATLASEQTYEAIDKVLKEFPSVTLDQFIKANFENPAPKKPGPKL
jgi:hypothetical protein